ncbi:F-box protein [Phanerochaete sordida]|uniref:F-box protein n=1 Tax=Phanerochaete sordida TaxID=48140 RepID=A0A9P3GJS9_9APHY|nr:F-box protein [Phanerochaete sordida]
MDSEDERIEVALKSKKKDKYYSSEDRPTLDLRLYQLEEYSINRLLKHSIPTKDSDRDHTPEGSERLSLRIRGVPYRFVRLCDTVKGFHMGYLDLSGRHEYRYQSARKRLEEVNQVLTAAVTTSRIVEYTEDDLKNTKLMWFTLDDAGHPADYILTDKVSARKLKKWGLPIHQMDSLVSLVENVHRCTVVSPQPKFQTLRLLDLPNELLHQIARRTEPPNLRSFSLTCKLLREVSWQILNEERMIGLTSFVPHDWKLRAVLSPAEQHEEDCKFAIAERKRFLRHTDMICSRTDIAQGIVRLTFVNYESSGIRQALRDSPENFGDFGQLFNQRLLDVALKTVNVTKLSLHHITLTTALADAIFAFRHLANLHLSTCAVEFGDSVPRNRPKELEHLSLLCFGTEDDAAAQWQVVNFIPHLRWLFVRGSHDACSLPVDISILRTNPFATLERLRIHRVNRFADADDLATLFTLLHTSPTLCLTHLKLEFADGISEDETFALVDALARAPLRLLVLEGLDAAPPRLLTHIGDAFPALEGLSLVFRESPIQTRLRDARWPAPAWEYAEALARCARLEHFGWNYRLDMPTSPATLLHFEEGFCGYDCEHSEAVEADFDEAGSLVPLFAVHVPSLCSLAFLGSTIFPFATCRITRDIENKPTFEVNTYMFAQDPLWEGICERYNPGSLSSESWPLLDETMDDLY